MTPATTKAMREATIGKAVRNVLARHVPSIPHAVYHIVAVAPEMNGIVTNRSASDYAVYQQPRQDPFATTEPFNPAIATKVGGLWRDPEPGIQGERLSAAFANGEAGGNTFPMKQMLQETLLGLAKCFKEEIVVGW